MSICTCTRMSAFASRFDSTGRTCSTDSVLREDDADGATKRQENTSVKAAQPSQFTAPVTDKVLCSVDRYIERYDLKSRRRRLDVV